MVYKKNFLGRPAPPTPLPTDQQSSAKMDHRYPLMSAGMPQPYPHSPDDASLSPGSVRNSPSPNRPLSPTGPDDLSLSKRTASPKTFESDNTHVNTLNSFSSNSSSAQ